MALAVTVKFAPAQIVVEGEALILTDGVVGLESVTANELAVLVPQVLPAVTVTFPPVDPKLIVIEFVPVPLAILAPAGTAQL